MANESEDRPNSPQPHDGKQPAGTPVHSVSDELVNIMIGNLTENNANPEAIDAKRAARDARTKPAFPAMADENQRPPSK